MSYKALLNAKAYMQMYNSSSNFGVSATMSAGDGAGYSRGNEQDDSEHEDSVHSDENQEDYQNGEGAASERQGSEEGENMHFTNISLKRCRFAPCQDIALMKEVFAADDKPYDHVGKAAVESWGKIAHVLNQKQIFGPVLTLSALTCKLRFEFLIKNYGGSAMKFIPKRGTIEEFQKRDELIAMMVPLVPHSNGRRKRRGHWKQQQPSPTKQPYSPAAEVEDEPAVLLGESEPAYVGHSMLDSPFTSNKRKGGRPKKVVSQDGVPAGGGLNNEYHLRPRLAHKVDSEPPANVPMTPGPSSMSPMMRYFQQQAAGSSGATMVHLMVEYLKQQHESDLQFRRDERESRQRERSEERRLEREKLEVRKADIALEQEKWDVEKRERELNLELMRKRLAE